MTQAHLTLVRYDDAVLSKVPSPQVYVQQHFLSKFVAWFLNGDYRHAASLVDWLEEQVRNPAESVRQFITTHNLVYVASLSDDVVVDVQRAVIDSLTYITDAQHWGVPDKWNTADETLTATVTTPNGVTFGPMEGDCEDGAILMYVVCRLLGVPAESLYIWAGDTVAGGHACLVYRPRNYPLNWVFLDWCFYPDRLGVENKVIYQILGKDVLGERVNNGVQTGEIDTHYISAWFIFSEQQSFSELNYKVN